jgi:5'-nucleotidase / UDP-sugar diphosphatase
MRRALLTTAMCAAALSGCDSSSEPRALRGQVRMTLLHTSDIHSRLFPYNLQIGEIDAGLGLGEVDDIASVGGAARISHVIGRERARAERVLHLDGGDCFQGAPVFNFFQGEAEIKTLSTMGADAMIVANHEFDQGALNLGIQLQQWANFPVLVANYNLEDPSQPGASPLGTVIQPFQIFDLEGLRVSVIGMGNLSSITSIFDQPNRLGVVPLKTSEVAQFYVDLLRPISDVIVMVTHLGLEVDQRMIEDTEGIDIVLGGHNHIVLQPPKRVRDCGNIDDVCADQCRQQSGGDPTLSEDCVRDSCHYIETVSPDPQDPAEVSKKQRRPCVPRDVVLAHSGAFAKYVGRLDTVFSNDPADFVGIEGYRHSEANGFEVVSYDYRLFPINATVPEDPLVRNVLAPYASALDLVANLDLLVGYAPDGSRRFSSTAGDSALGNMISTAMWLRLGIQTDFSLTNTTGIRADIVPGAVTVEQMYNIFPFDNSISKMQLSGFEIQELFDFVARRSAGRGCTSQVQIAGARVVLDCTLVSEEGQSPGIATNIYIGPIDPEVPCSGDAECPGGALGACDTSTGRCWQAIDPIASYELATSNYLASGGSGFRVLQRNTTQFDTKIQQRDALIDYIRAGKACGSEPDGDIQTCATDADCVAKLGDAYVCACPDVSIEGDQCTSDPAEVCPFGSDAGDGGCVLARCRQDVADFQRDICNRTPTEEARQECLTALAPCATGGETCKFLACIDAGLGNNSDGRVKMVGK